MATSAPETPVASIGFEPRRSQRERQRLETREMLFELAIAEFRRVGTALDADEFIVR
jgi:hypothetical protein